MVNWYYLSDRFEHALGNVFGAIGAFNGRRPLLVIVAGLVFAAGTALGLLRADELMIREVDELFVPQDTVAFESRDKLLDSFGEGGAGNQILTIFDDDPGADLLADKEFLYQLYELEEQVVALEVQVGGKNGRTITFEDVCHRWWPAPDAPCQRLSPLAFWQYDLDKVAADPNIRQTLSAESTRDPATGVVILQAQVLGGLFETDDGELAAAALLSSFVVDVQEDEAEIEWQRAFIDFAQGSFEDLRLYRLSQQAFEDEIDRAVQSLESLVVFSVILTLIFLILTLGSSKFEHSSALLGVAGLVSIIAATGSGLGLSYLFGNNATPLSPVLYFLLLGLGVDSLVLLVTAYQRTPLHLSVEERNAMAMKVAGPFIFLTSFTTFVVFCVSASSRFPGVSYFSLSGATAIFCNWVAVLTVFDSFVVLNGRRIAANRYECWPFAVRKHSEPTEATSLLGGSPGKPAHLTVGIVDKIAQDYYAPLLERPLFVGAVLLVFAGIVGGSVYMLLEELEEGLKPEDVVPDDSFINDFLDATEQYPTASGAAVSVVIGPTDYADYATTSLRLQELTGALVEEKAIDSGSIVSVWTFFDQYLDLIGVQPDRRGFIGNVTLFVTVVAPQFQYDIIFDDPENPTEVINSRIMCQYDLAEMAESNKIIRNLADLRTALDEYGFDDTYAFANEDLVFDSFTEVRDEVLRNMGVSGAVVFAITLLLLHPGAACLILVLVLAMDVELLAWIPLVGEKLNSITLIIVVLSIGLVVDFSAHIAHAFLLSGRPTRSEKAAQAVAELGRPLLSGGFSTFLGVCLLAFASAPANRTFFYMLSGVVLVGVINGLVLLPALLTLVGPKTTPSGKSAN